MRLPFRKILTILTAAAIAAAGPSTAAESRLSAGEPAPDFSLAALDGRTHALSMLKGRPLSILFFFDPGSRPSQEGLVSLDRLARRHAREALTVWAITRAPREKAAQFAAHHRIETPILLDHAEVSEGYRARLVLPTACILGPDLRVVDFIQGGGTSTEILLTRLAERSLERRQLAVTREISAQISMQGKRHPQTQLLGAWAALKAGDLPGARQIFEELARQGGPARTDAVEGLAAVSAAEGRHPEALELLRQLERQAPDRGYGHLLRGDILYANGRKEAAESEYRLAAEKRSPLAFQRIEPLNRLGRLEAEKKRYDAAHRYYDQAIEIDPYNIESTANKGVAYEREGRWNQALEAYQKAVSVDRGDGVAAALARQMQEKLALQEDADRKRRLDELVRDLARRYREQARPPQPGLDAWTSPPLVATFIDVEEKGFLSDRDGLSGVLTSRLAELLNASGRMQVVDRRLLERLLEELNLGSSELADPATALKLGRVLAARLIGTGALVHTGAGSLVSLRLIDTETTVIAKVITRPVDLQRRLDADLFALNREILETVARAYPLQGFVVRLEENGVLLNIGQRQGVVAGTPFEVLREAAPVTYKGKTLEGSMTPVARLKVVQVEPDFSRARIVHQEAPLAADDKVREAPEPAP